MLIKRYAQKPHLRNTFGVAQHTMSDFPWPEDLIIALEETVVHEASTCISLPPIHAPASPTLTLNSSKSSPDMRVAMLITDKDVRRAYAPHIRRRMHSPPPAGPVLRALANELLRSSSLPLVSEKSPSLPELRHRRLSMESFQESKQPRKMDQPKSSSSSNRRATRTRTTKELSERAGTTASEATLRPRGAAKPSDPFEKPSSGALSSMLLAKGSSLRRSLDEAKAALPEQLNAERHAQRRAKLDEWQQAHEAGRWVACEEILSEALVLNPDDPLFLKLRSAAHLVR